MEIAQAEPTPDPTERWMGIDHVQLAIPVGGEQAARRFFVGVLGFTEVAKPPSLAARGGAWFEAGATRIHVGTEPDFVPARKAHPALLVRGLRALVADAGIEARWSDEVPGTTRCHVDDPFGNRIELIEGAPSAAGRDDQDVRKTP
jgi:catechol 2,3-dioxygenase-like lactoylglutathione lyase family enzyme